MEMARQNHLSRCLCMAIIVSVQHKNGGFLTGIILLTQCHYHRGTRLNAMKRFLKKNLNASRPSEHPSIRGKNVKTL